MDDFCFHRQRPVPLQGILQPHIDRWNNNQRQQGRKCKASDHGNGKRCTYSSRIFRIAHCEWHHGDDGCDGGNQDRPDTGDTRCHQCPFTPVSAFTKQLGVIDQDNAVVHHHTQQDKKSH